MCCAEKRLTGRWNRLRGDLPSKCASEGCCSDQCQTSHELQLRWRIDAPQRPDNARNASGTSTVSVVSQKCHRHISKASIIP